MADQKKEAADDFDGDRKPRQVLSVILSAKEDKLRRRLMTDIEKFHKRAAAGFDEFPGGHSECQ